MPKYTNKHGELIEVDVKHIEDAIRIKLELQKSVPSGRCSWKKHKELMILEGHHNSDVNENYRVLVREQQRKRDLLPTHKKYAEFVSNHKLKALESMVGETYVAKQELNKEKRELNKLKREISKELSCINSIKDVIVNSEFNFSKEVKIKNIEDTIAVVTPSDWHIGLMIDNEINYETARNRILEYANVIISTCDSFKINEIYVCHLGDIINNVYMHKNTQAYNSEFDMSQQIVKATKLMIEFLDILAIQLKVNYIGTISGNHGRLSTKGETLTNDSVEVMIHEFIKTMIDERIKAGFNNLQYCDSGYHKSYATITVNNKNFCFVHGDNDNGKGESIIKKYSSITNSQIDYLIKGHIHNFRVESENYNRKIITCGSLLGCDDYAKTLGFYTGASQSMFILNEDLFIPLDINLEKIKSNKIT